MQTDNKEQENRSKLKSIMESQLNTKDIRVEKIIINPDEDVEIDLNVKNSQNTIYLFILKKGAKAFIKSYPKGDSTIGCEFILEENSKLSFAKIKDRCGSCLDYQMATLAENSSFEYISFWTGSGKRNVFITSSGDNSQIRGIEMIISDENNDSTITLNADIRSNDSSIDLRSNVAAYEGSSIKISGVMKSTSSSINTSCSLKESFLLLGERANITAIPAIETKGDKTISKHAVEISRMSKRKLFYLQSRGLSKRDAEAMIILSFIRNGFSEIKDRRILSLYIPHLYKT